MNMNKNIAGVGIRRTDSGRAKIVYTTAFSCEEHDAYDGDFPIDEARAIMKEHRIELKRLRAET